MKRRLTRMGNMPELYSTALERPKQDLLGFDVLYVDVRAHASLSASAMCHCRHLPRLSSSDQPQPHPQPPPLTRNAPIPFFFPQAQHRGNLTARMSHSCAPNCKIVNCIVGGRITLAVFTIAEVPPGAELTIDYATETESEKEYRAAVCLCSSGSCRGSFMYLANHGSAFRSQFLQARYNFLDRNAALLLCGQPGVVITEQDKQQLAKHGFGLSLLIDGDPEHGVCAGILLTKDA